MLVHLVSSVVWAPGLGKTAACWKPSPTPPPPPVEVRRKKVAENP